MLNNDGVKPKPTGDYHWLEYLPNHAYCFLPSLTSNYGSGKMLKRMPAYIKDMLYGSKIEKVRILDVSFCKNFTVMISGGYQM